MAFMLITVTLSIIHVLMTPGMVGSRAVECARLQRFVALEPKAPPHGDQVLEGLLVAAKSLISWIVFMSNMLVAALGSGAREAARRRRKSDTLKIFLCS